MQGRAGSEIREAHVSRNIYVKNIFYVKNVMILSQLLKKCRITQIRHDVTML